VPVVFVHHRSTRDDLFSTSARADAARRLGLDDLPVITVPTRLAAADAHRQPFVCIVSRCAAAQPVAYRVPGVSAPPPPSVP
jgi:hypothetical protein